jgi:aryl carrier-like protein
MTPGQGSPPLTPPAGAAAADARQARAAHLRRYLEDRLPGHMVPAAIVEIDKIPLMPNQKVDLAALPDPPEEPAAPVQAERVPPGDAVVEAVATIWQEVLGRGPFLADDNFFQVGGNSLAVMRVLTQLRRRLGATVTVHQFIQRPTIGALVDAIWQDIRV